MFPLTFFLAASTLDQAVPVFTIEEVKVNRRFAGMLGARLITEIVLTSGSSRYSVTLKDVRHSRFQKSAVPLAAGDKVRIPGGLSAPWTALRPDQIKPV